MALMKEFENQAVLAKGFDEPWENFQRRFTEYSDHRQEQMNQIEAENRDLRRLLAMKKRENEMALANSPG